jgi:glycosyltransferase involved in cell wall biosynthesis
MQPKPATLSVLLPVRNGAAFSRFSIASILAQSCRDFEFLIIDDGSTDATAAILAEFAGTDPRIKIVKLAPSGLVAALNLGLQLAGGTWVARIDADDIAWPMRLERQMAFAQTHPNAAAIGSFWRIIDSHGTPGRIHSAPTEPAAIAASLQTHNTLAHPTMLLRREAVLHSGGYRKAFLPAEDYDLWLRLAEQFEIHVIPEVLLDYREHAGQTNWGYHEQRILAVRAAQFAATARQAGRPDPFEHIERLDQQSLHAAGLSKQAVEAALIEGSRNAAVDAVAAGQGTSARAALQLMYRQPSLRWKTRLHGYLLGARSWVR